MTRFPVLFTVISGLIAGLGPGPLSAQVVELPGRVAPRIAPPAPAPFGPGEFLTYKVKLGIFTVGHGHMQVEGLETVRGHTTYRVSMGIDGGVPFYHLTDLFRSWIGVEDLVGRRFIKDQDENGKLRFEHWEFFPEERRYERVDKEEEGEIPTCICYQETHSGRVRILWALYQDEDSKDIAGSHSQCLSASHL